MVARTYWVGSALLGIVIIFTILNMRTAIQIGALSVPPIYDDCSYLWDGYQRLAFGGNQTVTNLISSFFSDPPHAPFETLTVMVGFSLFGPNNYGPYIANAWFLAVYVAGVYCVARSKLECIPSLLLTLVMMFVPAAGAIITELRPDMAAGVMFSFAAYALINFNYYDFRIRRLIVLGFAVAFAIMIKPTAAVITIPMLGLAGLMGLLLVVPVRLKAAIPAAGVVLIAALVLLIPFAIVWGMQTYHYIIDALITNKDVWYTPGSWSFHLSYNSFGIGGRRALSYFLPFGLLMIAADFILTLQRGVSTRAALATLFYYGWCCIVYIGTALTAYKSFYQGSFFYFPFIVATTIAVSRIVGKLKWGSRPRPAISVVVLFATTLVFLPASNTYQDGRWRAGTSQMLAQITALISDQLLRGDLCGNTTPIYTFISPYPVTPEAVAIELAQKYGKELNIRTKIIPRTLEDVAAQVRRSNFVLIPNNAGLEEGLNQHWPGVAFVGDIFKSLKADQKWSEHQILVDDPPTLFVRHAC